MEVKVRVKGVTQYVRDLSQSKKGGHEAAVRGILKSAEYLITKIKAKFGIYQPGWAKLKYETIARKLRKGHSKGPLLGTGDMRDSFTVVKGGKGRLSASVGSNDPKLIHHVYGAPRAGVPKRDPVRTTAEEEKRKCEEIIIDEIMRGWKGGV